MAGTMAVAVAVAVLLTFYVWTSRETITNDERNPKTCVQEQLSISVVPNVGPVTANTPGTHAPHVSG